MVGRNLLKTGNYALEYGKGLGIMEGNKGLIMVPWLSAWNGIVIVNFWNVGCGTGVPKSCFYISFLASFATPFFTLIVFFFYFLFTNGFTFINF